MRVLGLSLPTPHVPWRAAPVLGLTVAFAAAIVTIVWGRRMWMRYGDARPALG